MKNDYFLSLENLNQGEQQPLTQVLEHLSFDANGIIPVIAQDHHSRERNHAGLDEPGGH